MLQLTDLNNSIIAYRHGKPIHYDHSMRVKWHLPNSDYHSISQLREFQAARDKILVWLQTEFGKVAKERWAWANQSDWFFDVGFNNKKDMILFKLYCA